MKRPIRVETPWKQQPALLATLLTRVDCSVAVMTDLYQPLGTHRIYLTIRMRQVASTLHLTWTAAPCCHTGLQVPA